MKLTVCNCSRFIVFNMSNKKTYSMQFRVMKTKEALIQLPICLISKRNDVEFIQPKTVTVKTWELLMVFDAGVAKDKMSQHLREIIHLNILTENNKTLLPTIFYTKRIIFRKSILSLWILFYFLGGRGIAITKWALAKRSMNNQKRTFMYFLPKKYSIGEQVQLSHKIIY